MRRVDRRRSPRGSSRCVALLAIGMGGCVSVDDNVGPWRAVADITGALATECGPALAPRAAPATLRVVSWNLHFGQDAEGLAAALATSPELAKADVILTQEIESHPGEGGSRASRMAGALGMTWVYAPSRIQDTGTHGLAIMSRFPILGAEVRDLPHYEMPNGQSSRIALAATLELGHEQVRVVDVHLDVRLGVADRIRQLDPAVDGTTTLLLGGDFNSVPWSWIDGFVPLLGPEAIVGQETPKILDDYMHGVGFAGAIDPGTDTLTKLPVRCDDLYATAPIVRGSVEHVTGSDHWPIWMELSWAASP